VPVRVRHATRLAFGAVDVVTCFVDLAAQRAAFFRRHPSVFLGIVVAVIGRIVALVSEAAGILPANLLAATTVVRCGDPWFTALVTALDGNPLHLKGARKFPHVPPVSLGVGRCIRHRQNEQERYADLFEPDIHNYSFAIHQSPPRY
jgi:hypothetical protein